MKALLLNEIEKMKEQLWEINDYLYMHPELGDQEYKALAKLTRFLENHGFIIQEGIAGRPTAFKAVYDSGLPGPTVAYLCEYDALPEIGHGCGHNMIGTMSAGAGAALSKLLPEVGGRIIVLGTPAEETNGAKVDMAEQGVFEDIDAAMILHPDGLSYSSGTSLAMDAVQFCFKGRACHAASEPEKGINALDAVIMTFNGINALRQHVTPDVRIHGIIKEGGVAPNIVPDHAVAQFYIRAAKKAYLKEVVARVKDVARGAALMTGASLEISNYEISYDDMNTNESLSAAFNANMAQLGIEVSELPKSSMGSIDMGNVSYVVPAIHPYIGLNCPNLPGHTKEMADRTITGEAHAVLLKGTAALAYTGYDIMTDEALLGQIKAEFQKVRITSQNS